MSLWISAHLLENITTATRAGAEDNANDFLPLVCRLGKLGSWKTGCMVSVIGECWYSRQKKAPHSMGCTGLSILRYLIISMSKTHPGRLWPFITLAFGIHNFIPFCQGIKGDIL